MSAEAPKKAPRFWVSISDRIHEVLVITRDGLTRRQIISSLGLTDDKSAQESVSNALVVMLKAGVIVRRDKKYTVAQAHPIKPAR
jgi:hypothetical protein